MNHEPQNGQIWEFDIGEKRLGIPGPFVLLEQTRSSDSDRWFRCLNMSTGSVDLYIFNDANFHNWRRLA